jgi:hypothetical protein
MQQGESSGCQKHCCLGDVLRHLPGVLVEQRVMLDEDKRVACLSRTVVSRKTVKARRISRSMNLWYRLPRMLE